MHILKKILLISIVIGMTSETYTDLCLKSYANTYALRPQAGSVSGQGRDLVLILPRRTSSAGLAEDKTFLVDMPSPDPSQREAVLRMHAGIKDRMHPDDLEAVKLLVMNNQQPQDNERTAVYELIHPITAVWGDMHIVLTRIYAKGVVFDSTETLSRHEGSGVVAEKLTPNKRGVINSKEPVGSPQGACSFEEAEREFFINDLMFFSEDFQNQGILTKFPAGYGKFPGLHYFSDTDGQTYDIGFVLFGCSDRQSIRTAPLIAEKSIRDNIAIAAAMSLRFMHEKGISHPWYHIGNFAIIAPFPDDYVRPILLIHDLGECVHIKVDNFSREQFMAQIFVDLRYAARKIEEYHGTGDIFLDEYFKYHIHSANLTMLEYIEKMCLVGFIVPLAGLKIPIVTYIDENIIKSAFNVGTGTKPRVSRPLVADLDINRAISLSA